MSEGKHSPLPWAQGDGTSAPDEMVLMDADGLGVADFAPSNPDCSTDRAKANARLAKTAANSHARLVEGLEEAAQFLDGAATALENRQDENHVPVRRAARRARTLIKELSHD